MKDNHTFGDSPELERRLTLEQREAKKVAKERPTEPWARYFGLALSILLLAAAAAGVVALWKLVL